jgi:NADPH:quinone reductase-like Zn-dependent oxidoreductase
MKAVRFHEQGGVEVLRYEEAPDPEIGPEDVLVRVRVCALNHLDIWVRSTLPVALPHIVGSDVAGEVQEVGERVSGFKPGDRVVLNPALNCGACEWCLAGDESVCVDFKILGNQVDGGYAELVKAPAKNVHPIPKGLSFEQAAAFPLVFMTAWHMLLTRAHLSPGETCLIHAAGSGIGSAAIQVAKLCGARVITTAGSGEKLERARELGADELINYREADFAKRVLEITDGRGVDVVFEHIGPETWKGSLRCLARNGRLVLCGATSGPTVELDLRFFYSRQHSVIGSIMGTRREFQRILQLVAAGRLKPVIDRTFPLAQAAEAQTRMEQRKSFGKILLVP